MGSVRGPSLPRWSLQDAKNKLSSVVDAAARGLPQIVTKRGKETAVVISYDDFQRLQAHHEMAPPSLGEYLFSIPADVSGEDDVESTASGVPDALS